MYRANAVVSEDSEKEKERKHVKAALKVNGYPEWLFSDSVKEKTRKVSGKPAQRSDRSNRPVVIPYIKGVSEKLRSAFGRFGVATYFKPVNTLRQLLVRPKDPISKRESSGTCISHPLWG